MKSTHIFGLLLFFFTTTELENHCGYFASHMCPTLRSWHMRALMAWLASGQNFLFFCLTKEKIMLTLNLHVIIISKIPTRSSIDHAKQNWFFCRNWLGASTFNTELRTNPELPLGFWLVNLDLLKIFPFCYYLLINGRIAGLLIPYKGIQQGILSPPSLHFVP